MATRNEVYAKFGMASETAQLFETDLGNILISLEGTAKGWNESPDPATAAIFMERLDRKTLGQMLKSLKEATGREEVVIETFSAGLAARNSLSHGFFQRHNFAIHDPDGRDRMIEDLESLHHHLHEAWQIARAVADILHTKIMESLRAQ